MECLKADLHSKFLSVSNLHAAESTYSRPLLSSVTQSGIRTEIFMTMILMPRYTKTTRQELEYGCKNGYTHFICNNAEPKLSKL